MTGFRYALFALMFMLLGEVAMAQNNTNSPYTRYGYGDLADQYTGNSKAMGGIAIGLRDKSQINPVNPASYTAIDTLTFLFEGGLSLQNMNVSEGSMRRNAKNTSLDYIAMQFRLRPWMAMSIGLLPYSSVGYAVSDASTTEEGLQYSRSFSGDGGLHQLYAGLGVKLLKNLSVGANVSYLFGDITRIRDVYFPESESAYYYEQTSALSVSDYKLDFGLQYTQDINKKTNLTLGAVYSPKRGLNNDYSIQTRTSVINQQDLQADLQLPNSFGVGVSVNYDRRITVGADYSLQKWSQVSSSLRSDEAGLLSAFDETFAYCDRSKFSIGAEYIPNLLGRYYMGHVKYRLGAYYSTPYYKIDGKRAVTEYGITAGFGLPVPRSRSILSVTGQFVKVKGANKMLTDENIFGVSIGITFSESWFSKVKVQ